MWTGRQGKCSCLIKEVTESRGRKKEENTVLEENENRLIIVLVTRNRLNCAKSKLNESRYTGFSWIVVLIRTSTRGTFFRQYWDMQIRQVTGKPIIFPIDVNSCKIIHFRRYVVGNDNCDLAC